MIKKDLKFIEEFKGELLKINPDKILGPKEHEDIGSFFIALGMIYNDLKCLLWMSSVLENKYRKPIAGEISPHAGNYNGTKVYLHKILVSTLDEFFSFLISRKKIFKNDKFLQILKRLPQSDQKIWKDLELYLDGKDENLKTFISSLAVVRSNVAFHYDQSDNFLKKGFIKFFSNSPKNKFNQEAYYSVSDSMELTRYYFADAAVEASIPIMLENKLGKNLSRYVADFKYNIAKMTISISSILSCYLKFARNEPGWRSK